MQNTIKIIHAQEGNLKDISLEIPKNQLVVLTGVSGSGKSTLLRDVLYMECQRQYLEAMAFQGIQKPKVERIQGASPAILLTQKEAQKNPRSTVGTLSDLYTDLRMIYEKCGYQQCPSCHHWINPADCLQETEKSKDQFHVFMICSHCHHRFEKLTRSHFSFNTQEGACPHCQGMGVVATPQIDKILDEQCSLETGAVRYWEKQYGLYQTSIFYQACQAAGLPVPQGEPIQQYSKNQRRLLLEGTAAVWAALELPAFHIPKNISAGKFEGVLPILQRRFQEHPHGSLSAYFTKETCPICHGERLNSLSRSITVMNTRLPELACYSLEQLSQWTETLKRSLTEAHRQIIDPYLLDIQTKLSRFIKVGLGYLTLDRTILTLSGGEMERMRLAAMLDSEICGILFLLDEPTAGLHPQDTAALISLLRQLRDLGNSVLVIEHDLDVIQAADWIIEMGPRAGKAGGEIIAQGTLKTLMETPCSPTAQALKQTSCCKMEVRSPTGSLQIKNGCCHNLQHFDLTLPTGCLITIAGPSGSGKSTLIFDILAKGQALASTNRVLGLDQFDQLIEITQAPLSRMKRSCVATYLDLYGPIRSLFANSLQAKKAGLSARHFSFNAPGGRCETCQGLGKIENNMLFFANNEILCPTYHGQRFQPNVLEIQYQGLSILDILELSVEEACLVFQTETKLYRALRLLQETGLGYLQLGQTLNSLSQGECQRLKLADELIQHVSGHHRCLLLDEPTTGLHPQDIAHFLQLIQRLIGEGDTVILVEHNQEIIRNSDWVVELGPGGGDQGGQLIFEGTPSALKQAQTTTGKIL